MRGRKPKPNERKFAEGDTRHVGAKKLAAQIEAAPKAARGIPDPPAHLGELAKQQWYIWREDLEIMKQDYRADALMLEGALPTPERSKRTRS